MPNHCVLDAQSLYFECLDSAVRMLELYAPNAQVQNLKEALSLYQTHTHGPVHILHQSHRVCIIITIITSNKHYHTHMLCFASILHLQVNLAINRLYASVLLIGPEPRSFGSTPNFMMRKLRAQTIRMQPALRLG